MGKAWEGVQELLLVVVVVAEVVYAVSLSPTPPNNGDRGIDISTTHTTVIARKLTHRKGCYGTARQRRTTSKQQHHDGHQAPDQQPRAHQPDLGP